MGEGSSCVLAVVEETETWDQIIQINRSNSGVQTRSARSLARSSPSGCTPGKPLATEKLLGLTLESCLFRLLESFSNFLPLSFSKFLAFLLDRSRTTNRG